MRLLAGARDLEAPDYDFAALGPVLLARSWHPAELDLEGEAAKDGAWWGRWVLPAALGVAAVFLLLLLRRILSEGGMAPREGLEPPTNRLTADCSTTELPRNVL